ncbi:MAG TPA: DUF1697 domain-containing protein [Candidatus Acidoferrum sp.]|nr:DUF1697 domain-containing protein [Candidatus Acidoferrum sp.]
MPAIICMLRGVNVGGHNKIQMEALRALCESLKLKSPQTYVQSGNVVFLSTEKNLALLSQRIQDAIERNFGFRPDVVLRTSSEMRHVIARNPFASRHGIDAAKLLVTFLAAEPAKLARESLLELDTRGEEIHFHGNELYIYFRNGIGKTKLSWAAVEKALNTSFTGRNWNTVIKLHEMAESLEESV